MRSSSMPRPALRSCASERDAQSAIRRAARSRSTACCSCSRTRRLPITRDRTLQLRRHRRRPRARRRLRRVRIQESGSLDAESGAATGNCSRSRALDRVRRWRTADLAPQSPGANGATTSSSCALHFRHAAHRRRAARLLRHARTPRPLAEDVWHNAWALAFMIRAFHR